MTSAKDNIHSYEEIGPNVFRIDESGIANCYLIIGEQKALLIDSGVGVGNLLECVEELTDKPVTLALTHRHCDHAGGRDFFPNYYVHEADNKLVYKILSSHFACSQLLKMNHLTGFSLSKKPYHSKLVLMKDDTTFDLGERLISLVHVPGHTEGSVVFLDSKSNIMFTGDDVNPYLWLQLPGCTCLSRWLPGAEKILALAATYTSYCGHDKGLITKDGIATLIARVKEILDKKPEFQGKALDYPPDKTVFPRVLVARKGIK